MSQKEDSWGPDSVLVRFIDEGRTGLVTSHQLLRLPEHFHTLPPQAVEFIVCRVKPADNEVEWNPKVSYFGFLCFIFFYILLTLCGGLFEFKVLSLGKLRHGPGQLKGQSGSPPVWGCAHSRRHRPSSQAPDSCPAPSLSFVLTVLEPV